MYEVCPEGVCTIMLADKVHETDRRCKKCRRKHDLMCTWWYITWRVQPVSLFVLTYTIVHHRLGPEVSRKYIATVGKFYRHFKLWTRRGRLKFYGRILEKSQRKSTHPKGRQTR
jgi:hypothetical protein